MKTYHLGMENAGEVGVQVERGETRQNIPWPRVYYNHPILNSNVCLNGGLGDFR